MFKRCILALFGWLAAGTLALEAGPFDAARVTRVENQVSYGQVADDKSRTRPAVADDIIKANNFLLSETDSRAELRYEDGTIVRIGQNTIFSFEASTRTLHLTKGTFVFYVPKGKGGGTIKTPSFAAAISGTMGKVSDNILAIIEGEVTLIPSGRKVLAGFFARRNPDGSIEILPFDRAKEFAGKLMTFNGPLRVVPETAFGSLAYYLSLYGYLESQDRTNLPGWILQNNPPLIESIAPPKESEPDPIPAAPTLPPSLPPPAQPPPNTG